MTFWVSKQSSKDAEVFSLVVSPECCVGPPDQQFYMGGVGFGTAIDALERATNKPLLWATVQFISQTLSGATVDIDIDIPVNGRNVAQACATISDNGRLLHRTMAALGSRDSQVQETFCAMPDIPDPMSCPIKENDAFVQDGNLLCQFERRTAYQNDDEGRELLWVRAKDDYPLSAGMLAIMADFFLGAHTLTRGGTSLDNTFRMFRTAPTGWVLNVNQFAGIERGAVHGVVHQFAEDGTLLSIASQTGLLPKR